MQKSVRFTSSWRAPRPQHCCCYDRHSSAVAVAIFLSAPEMLLTLAVRLGDPSSAEQAEEVFDALVMRGLLRPGWNGLWDLAPISDAELRQLLKQC